jgi:hypothetical protein
MIAPGDALRSIALVLFGWILGQVERVFASRRDRRRAISTALTDLLETRHQYLGMELLFRSLETLGPIPEQAKSQLRVFVDSLLPDGKELHARYDQSVTTLAGLDPLLAFRFRSKDLLRPFVQRIHFIMSQDAQAAALLAPFLNQALAEEVEPGLNDAILTLAWKRGPLTWFLTRRALARPVEIPSALKNLLDSLKTTIEAQRQAAPPPPSK